MKKNYLLLAFLFSAATYGQGTFNNAAGAGNGKWGTATNWTPAALPTTTATISANVDLDVAASLSTSIQSATSTLTSSGVGKLTITGAASGAGIIGTGTNFIFNGVAEINTGSLTIVKNFQVNNTELVPASTTPNRQLTFGPLSILTLTTPGRTNPQTTFSRVVFQGKLEGVANLQFQGASQFDATSDNSNFNGDLVFFGAAATVVANTTGAGAFLKAGRKVQVNATSGSLTVNGANSYNGNINVGPGHAFTLNINANQGTFGNVISDGTLTINVATAVTNLSFLDCSALTWGGSVVITGYQSGEIRFGTNNSALTAGQLAKITADGAATGQTLALDASGYLVLASTLSSKSFATDNQAAISYPTLVQDKIYFSKPQNNVEIFNVTGNKVFTTSDKNGLDSITTSELRSGIYFIVFDGVKAEKFIKK